MTNEIRKSLIDRLETNNNKKKQRNYLEKRAFTLALECIVDAFVNFSSASSRRRPNVGKLRLRGKAQEI